MWQALVDLLFTPGCAACEADCSAPLCAICSESLYEMGSACPRCALPIDGPRSFECARCKRRPPPFVAAGAGYRYGGELARALRRLKYQRRLDIARRLAPLVGPALSRAAADADLAVPVPLHWRRLSRRTFNQAAALLVHAGPGIPVDKLSLRRVRATASQSGLDARRRAANVAAAFAVVPSRRRRIAGRRILLVDDVMTTGATMAACSRALLDSGAASVSVFAVARAES